MRAISRRIAEVSLGDKQAILDQYADILRLRSRLASPAPEDKAWTRDALDVRNRFTFDCAEWDTHTEDLIRTHSNAGDNSGGEQEKLMAFCLAGALSLWYGSLQGRAHRYQVITGKGYRRRLVAIGRYRKPAWILLGGYFALSKLVPLLILIWASLLPYFQAP